MIFDKENIRNWIKHIETKLENIQYDIEVINHLCSYILKELSL